MAAVVRALCGGGDGGARWWWCVCLCVCVTVPPSLCVRGVDVPAAKKNVVVVVGGRKVGERAVQMKAE